MINDTEEQYHFQKSLSKTFFQLMKDIKDDHQNAFLFKGFTHVKLLKTLQKDSWGKSQYFSNNIVIKIMYAYTQTKEFLH